METKIIKMKTKPTLSVILIANNESANILDCLASVSFADQIVVVDSGSTDNTVELARSAGAHVVQTTDWPGFGAQKNRALDLATCDWVFSIDADERVTPELAEQIKAAIIIEFKNDSNSANNSANNSDSKGNKSVRQVEAYEIPRLTQFCGKWIRHCGWTPDYVLRLFRRGSARFSNDLVHERIVQSQGTCGKLSTPMLHFSYPTPAQYWRKLDQYSQAWAKQRHLEGKRVSMLRAAGAGMVAFVRSYVFRLGFLDGAMGFAVCTMQAQAAFGKYFSLYCLNLKK
jgi:glycosyltransferase involved in cell wall biosynthesis